MTFFTRLRARVPERWAKRWPVIRAVLVTYHIVAIVLLGFPSPAGVMDKSSWQDATVQNEFRLWSARLRSANVDVQPEELQDALWTFGKAYVDIRSSVIAPFKPYSDYLGPTQSWQMFSAPQRYPYRLHISVREQSQWRPVYITRSKDETWMQDYFDSYRMRRVVFKLGWARDRVHYQTFCDWLADKAADDFPDATHLLVRQFEYRTPTPEEARVGQKDLDGKFGAPQIRPLKDRGTRQRAAPTQVEEPSPAGKEPTQVDP